MSTSTPHDPPPGREAEPSIGAFLAQQRRLLGITLEELEAATRVPRRSLERLEAGAFDASGDGFARGFVRTVAEALGLDPDETLARMREEPDPRRGRDPGPALRLGVWTGAGLAGLAAAAVVIWLLGRDPAARPEPQVASPSEDLVVRRDPVRELAARQPEPAPDPPADESTPAR